VAINEAEALAERSEHRAVFSRWHRLRGVFLAAMGAEDEQIEASFREAVNPTFSTGRGNRPFFAAIARQVA
jgi:hypothetical protein